MIESIGNVRRLVGIAKTASKAAGIVAKYGEAAIFFRVDTDVCVALSRTDPTWNAQLKRHGQHLVGVYSTNHSGYRLAQLIEADLRAHERHEQEAA